MNVVQLDRTNLHLLDLLQQDARMSVTDLARNVNRAETTVRERIGALERDRILKGYRAMIDPEKVGFHARATIRADCDLGRIHEVAKKLEAIPHVTGVQLTTGAKPLIIEALAENLPHLGQLLEKRIAPLQLRRIEVDLSVYQLVEPRPVALHAALGGDLAIPGRDGAGRETLASPRTGQLVPLKPFQWSSGTRPTVAP